MQSGTRPVVIAGKKRSLAKAMVAAFTLGVSLPACHEALPKAPSNVVLVVIDTLRSDHLAHYGYERPTDLALESFRNQATLFRHAYSTAPWTSPSVASLFSGLETPRHRTNAHGARLPDEIQTLAEVLRKHGYHTRGISHNAEVSRKTGFHQGFDVFEDMHKGPLDYPNAETMIAPLEQWLERWSQPTEGSSTPTPFFLYLQAMNTHGPYRVPDKARSTLLGRPASRKFKYRNKLMLGIVGAGRLDLRSQVSNSHLTSLSEQYDTSIRYTTDAIAEIFELLKRFDAYDNTLIVLTADHGEELFDHGGFSHGYSLHHEVLHVPLYVKLPGQRDARTVTSRVSLVDVFPTVAEELGATPASAVDGRSFSHLLRGEAVVAGEDRQLLHATSWKNRCVARAIVEGPYKLIVIDSNYEGLENEVRLYDLEHDAKEQFDIAPSSPSIVARLRVQLDRRFESLARDSVSEPENVLHKMDIDRLRALGYIDE